MQANRAAQGATLLIGLAICGGAAAQEFRPSQQQFLYQSTIAGAASTGFDSKAPAQKPAPSKQGQANKTKPKGQAGSVSVSSELSGGGQAGSGSTPNLKSSGVASAKKPFDDRIPFGPLSLGLQAGSGTPGLEGVPLPSGIEQYKKDRVDPYVGLSIIDIKR